LLALAEQLCLHEGEIWIGAVQGETEVDKGDKSELFFRLFEELVWRIKHKKIYIKDLKDKTKNEWLKMYLDETKDKSILNTITCFRGGAVACGQCQGCLRKWISMKFCGLDVNGFFKINPYEGCKKYVDKYKKSMQRALDNKDFFHYSESRCQQDLLVLNNYKK
jgi:hypothetical protein